MDDMLPVGISEIAVKLGVKRATVDQWLQRRLLPPPDWTVGGRPAWNWPTVRRWAEETGRIEVVTIAELAAEIGDGITTPERVARFAGCLSEYDPRTGQLPKPWYGKGMGATFTRDEADDLLAEWARASRATDGFTDLLDGTEPIERAPSAVL
jgi:predicted DNA-binding transcriptional regulator AlpA